MKVGFLQDWTNSATQKVVIVDETISGRYILKQMPIIVTRPDGSKYLAERMTGLFIRGKDEVFDIREEEIEL